MAGRAYEEGRRDWKWTGKWDTRKVGSADYRRGVRAEQAQERKEGRR